MRDDRGRRAGDRGDIMVERLQRIGVKIEKIAGTWIATSWRRPVPVVEIAAHEAVDQQGALGQRLARARDEAARLVGAHFADAGFEARAFRRAQRGAAFVSQEAFGKHG